MELDLGKVDQLEAASWMIEHGTLPEGSSLRKAVGEERYRRLTAEAGRLGLPMETADRQTPWVIGLELLELQYMQLGFDPEQGVEQQLERRAQTDGKPTSGLETVTEQLGVFETLSPEDQARFLDLVVTEMRGVESETQSVVAAWRTGDARKLAALLGDEYKSFPTLYRTLVTDRNRRWLPQIEQLLKDKDNYLVVVGAPVVAGLVHALYITAIGGDFMHARLLLPAVFGFVAPVAVISLAPRVRVALDPGARDDAHPRAASERLATGRGHPLARLVDPDQLEHHARPAFPGAQRAGLDPVVAAKNPLCLSPWRSSIII